MATKRSRALFEDDQEQQQHAPYAAYGTPLPPNEPDARDDGSYVPVWKQEVTDERGRKRLHGAFTGGFSAGYFNTVGSKEGWTPSTFVSSRSNRANDGKQPTQQKRPEDFMDEEDLREAEEARKLQTANEYAGFGSTATDSTRLGGLVDLFRASGETIGTKLLKRMGWKEGQGIGPKVRRKANLGAGDDTGHETYLFAPDNPPMISFIRKSDYKGLGFEGEARLEPYPGLEGGRDQDENGDSPFDRSKPSTNGKQLQKQKQQKRGGFGVGVLNDTGSDDEDPYEMGPKISYNRVIDQQRKARKATRPTDIMKPAGALSNPLLNSKPVFISKRRAAMDRNKSGFRKCHDGRLPLDGFLHGTDIAALSISDEKKYPPPEIPEGWKSAKEPSQPSYQASEYVSTAEAAKASTHDPKSRASLLGEEQLPGKSIFDYMTPEGRDRIVKATGRTDLPPALGEKGPEGYEVSEEEKIRDTWNLVPKLDKNVALQALSRATSGWTPYAEDDKKRARYRAFLEMRGGLSDKLPERVPDASTDEWLTELREFARAAEVFKPVSGLMASRFTSSKNQPGTSTDVPDALQIEQQDPFLRVPTRPEDPAETAARMGMYGPMTRLEIPFHPTRLLCKRFNAKLPPTVKPPSADEAGNPSPSDAGAPRPSEGPSELVPQAVMNQLMIHAGGGNGLAARSEEGENLPANARPKQDVVVDPERNEALESERPGEAVFKAIFGSDDEDED